MLTSHPIIIHVYIPGITQAFRQFMQGHDMIYIYQQLFPAFFVLLIFAMSQAQAAKRINIFSRNSKITIRQPIATKGTDSGQAAFKTAVHHA